MKNYEDNCTAYTRESNGAGWFVGVIVALALLAIGYLVFSDNEGRCAAGSDVCATSVEAPAS